MYIYVCIWYIYGIYMAYICIYMVFSLNIRFHTESWPKWDSSPQPRAYHVHGLTTVIVIIYIYILYIDLFICIVYIYIYINN